MNIIASIHPISEQLLIWFSINKRNLPWRNTQDPYRIWLSEIILQQTRISQGLPYYERFVEKFPSIIDLAHASQEEVFRLWQGLGYYSRAKNIHETAQKIAFELKGNFPKTFLELLRLKGLGKYTAAAVASFAFQEKIGTIDGNGYRVLSRIFGEKTNIASHQAYEIFYKRLEPLLPDQHTPEFNQALMELGALVCSPKNPKCENCPLRSFCFAFKTQTTADFPVKIKAATTKVRYLNYFVKDWASHFYLKKREKKDIWQFLYEFECIETKNPYFFEENPIFTLKNHSELYEHKLSHQRLFIQFFHVALKEKPLSLENFYSLDDIQNLPKPIILHQYFEKYLLKING